MDEEPTRVAANDIKRVAKDTGIIILLNFGSSFYYSSYFSVHKICSSQVIANIGIAVKELLENSIDAKASIVEIKFKNYGVDGFEVIDNGTGIRDEDFNLITAKHATSKLKSYSDLESLTSFGYRGEALSSLCALSDVSVTTRHSSHEIGTKMTFDHDGNIQETCNLARNIGTTVSVNNFLITLPVRRKEFLKNYKKDFNKMIELLQQYCIVLTNVKLSLINSLPNGNKQNLLSTNGLDVKGNLISIFGGKQIKDLVEIKSDNVTNEENEELTQQDIEVLTTSNFHLHGFISKTENGRNNKDRQYFYVNSRPVELSSIKKIVNDFYHKFNPKQFPFVYLNLKIDQSDCDINLSKDKRKIAVNNDKILQLAVRRALQLTFGETPSRLELSSINQSVKKFTIPTDSDDDDDDKIFVVKPSNKFAASLMQWKKTPDDPTPSQNERDIQRKRKLSDEKNLRPLKELKIDSFFKKNIDKDDDDDDDDEDDDKVETKISCKNIDKSIYEDSLKLEIFEKKISSPMKHEEDEKNDSISSKSVEKENLQKVFDEKVSNVEKMDEVDSDLEVLNSISNESQIEFVSQENSFNCNKINLSLESIRKLIENEKRAENLLEKQRKQRKLELQFKETVNSTKAESELRTEIKKEMFDDMQILGQYNLGFIITKLGSNLFIVDQHASDEKFNFENLRKTTKFQSQPLVVPENLDFNAVQELCIEENLHVFEKFGFKFEINSSQETGNRIKLIGKPHKGSWDFGRSDIEEIIFALECEQDKDQIEPSKVRKMFASKACRKSIMIGDSLNKQKMQQIVTNMAKMEHPWVKIQLTFDLISFHLLI
jgi:DNA mismatch repair protein PMS2